MNLNCAEFASKWATETGKKILLDVRNPDEVAQGTLPGSINIPVQELEQRKNEIPKGAVVYIYCKAGGRAKKAQEILATQKDIPTVCASEGGYEQLRLLIKM